MKWESGRQNYYYEKLKIFSFWRMDCYLIRYTEGCAVGFHRDEFPGFKHYRMNIQLRGVNTLCALSKCILLRKRIVIFRSDKLHSFGPTLEKGLILSFGLITKVKS